MYQAVFFDLDGTLINSLGDLAAATNCALGAQGYQVYPEEDYKYFVGNGVPKLIETVLPKGADEAALKKTRALFDKYYSAHYADRTRPYPGIPELIERLRGRGLKLAVVSNKPDNFVHSIVGAMFDQGSFDVVCGQRDGVPRKPDPAGPLQACRAIGVEPGRCVYVGDSGVDMLTGTAAGMFPVGVLWGFRLEDELRQNGAKALIAAPSELIKYI